MNNKQRAEEYAASKTKDIGYQKELIDAIQYGMQLAQDEIEDNMRKEMSKGYVLVLTEDGFEYIKRKDLDL